MDISNELIKLVELKDAGHLTEAEFDAAKQRLLSNAAPAADLAVTPAKSPFRGPPDECWNCGGSLKKGADAKSQGSGCLIALMGLIFAVVGVLLILSPIGWIGLALGGVTFIYGVHVSGKKEGFWRCKKCGSKFPREIRWYEFG